LWCSKVFSTSVGQGYSGQLRSKKNSFSLTLPNQDKDQVSPFLSERYFWYCRLQSTFQVSDIPLYNTLSADLCIQSLSQYSYVSILRPADTQDSGTCTAILHVHLSTRGEHDQTMGQATVDRPLVQGVIRFLARLLSLSA